MAGSRTRDGESKLLSNARDPIERMCATLDHGARNALAAAVLKLDVLARTLPGDPTIDNVCDDLAQLRSILDRLDLVLRPERSARPPFDVVEWLAERAESLPDVTVVTPVTETRKIDPCADAILVELVDNARRFGGPLTIELRRDPLRVHFRDSGPGIPHAIRARLGEAFITTAPERLGLGLHRVVRLADAARLTIAFEHPPEGGFVVELGLGSHGKTT